MRLYWYAPFNNADEQLMAEHVCREGDSLVVQSLKTRFSRPLPSNGVAYELLRNLPEPAGEGIYRNTIVHRAYVAIERARRRHKATNGPFDLLHIHTYNMFTDWASLPLLRRRGAPLVLWVHNVLPHARRGPASIEKRLHEYGYRAADHLIVAHPKLRTALEQQFGLDPQRITVIPLLVPRVNRVGDVRTTPRELLFFGTLRVNKGIEVLLEAIRKVPADLDVQFRFAGRGLPELQETLEKAAAADQRIKTELGWVSPARQRTLFSDASAVLLPYTAFPAQSGVLRDAYAYRVPVIASDVGALGSAVKEEGSGWTVPPGDPQALASAIIECIDRPSMREAFVLNIDRVARSRTPERTGGHLRSLYDQMRDASSG